jgi:hypothetical protein
MLVPQRLDAAFFRTKDGNEPVHQGKRSKRAMQTLNWR